MVLLQLVIKNKLQCYEEIIDSVVNNLANKKDLLIAQWNEKRDIETRFFFVDELLPESVAQNLYDDFLNSNVDWNRQVSFRETKSNFAKVDSLNNLIPIITDLFQDQRIINLIEEITDFKELDADPNLYAGGISKMAMNDFLNPHIDNSHDSRRKRYRRLNLLFYVTPDWIESNGGNLLLWDEKVIENLTILSKFNRLVVMETNQNSWHSVNPITIKKERFCLSNYYFSKNSPEDYEYYHVTSFSGRREQKFIRIFSNFDNFLRQKFSYYSGLSRGKNLSRFK